MSEDITLQAPRIDVAEIGEAVIRVKREIAKVIIGQGKMIDLLLAAILCNGHVLIEGVPGLAKTLGAKMLARTLDTGFSRIQFTPDLMPSDVTGTSIFNTKTVDFEFRRGPIFSNIVLIDEINRAPAKTQAALFEVMEERQITVDGHTYPMQPPFLVVATQNPIEQEGTYRLPEAQLDRFLFKIVVNYPNMDEEIMILNSHHNMVDALNFDEIRKILSASDIIRFQQTVRQVRLEANLIRYIAQMVQLTRNHGALFLGASPRASIAIMNGAKAIAAMNSRDFVIPEDIKEIAPAVLTHRIILTPEKEMEGSTTGDVVEQIIKSVEVPR